MATFSGLSIDKGGTGYTLTASSGTLTGATSATFDIAAAPAATQLAFTIQPTNATAGAAISPAVQVEVRDATGARVTAARDPVTLAIGTNPGTGTLSGTSTVNAVNGVATFSGLSIDKAGTGYTLTASSGTLTGATSAAFDIAPAPAATQLAFVVQPSNATTGTAISPAIQVEVRDATGVRVATAGNPVKLAIGANPGGGVLSGTTAVNAVNGVATFSGLSIDFAGTGYTLVASSATLTSATSAAFNVAARGVVYIIRDSDAKFQRLDPNSLAITDVGALGVGYNFGDCAWNPSNNTLYMVDGRATNTLYRINLLTGAATAIGVHGITDMFALGYHPPTNAIYGITFSPSSLYRFNLTTGAATLIGPTGVSSLEGLVWDPVRSQFVALHTGSDALYTIDVATGAATLLRAAAGSINDAGLTYDPVIDRFWSVDYSGNLFRYDPTLSYVRTSVLTGLGTHTCIAYVR